MWVACKSVVHGTLEHAAVCIIDTHLHTKVRTYLQESFKQLLSIPISLFGLMYVKVQHTQRLNLVGGALYILSVKETSTSGSKAAARRNYMYINTLLSSAIHVLLQGLVFICWARVIADIICISTAVIVNRTERILTTKNSFFFPTFRIPTTAPLSLQCIHIGTYVCTYAHTYIQRHTRTYGCRQDTVFPL